MTRAKPALCSWALLLSLIAGAAPVGMGQAAARATPAPTPTTIRATVTESAVDSSLPDDPAVDKMLTVYSAKVRVLDDVIGKLSGELKKGGVGAGSLGNFAADGIRAEAGRKLGKPVVLALTNGGGLRKNIIAAGDLRMRDIFELLPFENSLVAFDLTGSQVLDLLRVSLAHRDAQSGARIKYRINSNKQPELESARLLIDAAEKEIDPAAIYTVISIDYLLNVTGGDYAAVLKQASVTRPLGITIREAITNYVKTETAAGREIKSTFDGRFVFDKQTSAFAEGQEP